MTSTVTTPRSLGRAASYRGSPGALARRWPTGVGIAATAASLAVVAPLPDDVRTWVIAWWLLLAAVIYLTWGTARGDLTSGRLLSAQTAAVLGFGAVAMAAVVVDPAAARYVMAAGWLSHAAWDVVHHRLGQVVPRWYAEACLVVDLLLATALLAAGLL
jgi:hypothetical protein